MITTDNFWLWFGGIWLAAGVALLGIGGGIAMTQRSGDSSLVASGVRTEGIVLTKEIATPDDGPPRHRVTFRFTDERDTTIRGTAEVDAAAWDALAERGPIEVHYLAGDPQNYGVTGQTSDDPVIAFICAVAGIPIGAIGGALVVHALRSRRVRRELLLHGAAATATVTEVMPGNLRINGIPQWRLRYRFRDDRGQSHEGKCDISFDEAQRWQTGAIGRVRYDKRNARANVWTGERA